MYDINKVIKVLENLKSEGINYADFREIGDVLRISGISDDGWLSTLNYDLNNTWDKPSKTN